jgi:hypothetical protein
MQPYKGYKQEGMEGFFMGAVRGMVGVVTKPLAGFFDLASETTAAVRQSVQPAREHVARVRRPRCVGPDLILHPYSADDAYGCELLLQLNRHDAEERFVAMHPLGSFHALVTSERLLFVGIRPAAAPFVNSEIWYTCLHGYRVLRDQGIVYLEFTVDERMVEHVQEQLGYGAHQACRFEPVPRASAGPQHNLRQRCPSEQAASLVLGRIQFALNFWSQRSHSVQLVAGPAVGSDSAGTAAGST